MKQLELVGNLPRMSSSLDIHYILIVTLKRISPLSLEKPRETGAPEKLMETLLNYIISYCIISLVGYPCIQVSLLLIKKWDTCTCSGWVTRYVYAHHLDTKKPHIFICVSHRFIWGFNRLVFKKHSSNMDALHSLMSTHSNRWPNAFPHTRDFTARKAVIIIHIHLNF